MGVIVSIGFALFVAGISSSRRRSTELLSNREFEPSPIAIPPVSPVELAQPIDNRPPIPSLPPSVQVSIEHRAYSTHRIGDLSTDNCDSIYVVDETLRFAISDGASQSFNSGLWSRLLVQAWVDTDERPTIERLAADCSTKWVSQSTQEVSDIPNNALLITKMKDGSSATFGGIRWISDATTGGFWEAILVGDVLLLVTHTDSKGATTVQSTAPYVKPADFPTSPDQLRTSPPHLSRKAETLHLRNRDGLGFVLLTDAVARYAISLCARGTDLFSIFPFFSSSESEFRTWVGNLRNLGQIEDDDSSILFVQTSNSHTRLDQF